MRISEARLVRSLLAAFFVVAGFLRSADATPPIQILPIGDSLTYGEFVEGGYRLPLYQLLTNAGYSVDFVGTQTENGAEGLPDSDHEGYNGWRIDQIHSIVENLLNASADPDIVLLLIGVNDFFQNYETGSAHNRLEAVIGRISTNCPTAKIIVANLLDCSFYSVTNAAIEASFNPYVPIICSNYFAMGREVYFDDLRSALTPDDTDDGVHPSELGYRKMATNWFAAITNHISPLGTTNPPVIRRVEAAPDWTTVRITYSKPMADNATNVGNYSLSGGLPILHATLDSESRRVVTLTTSPQTPNSNYLLSVTSVRDLTSEANSIASNTTAAFTTARRTGVFNNVEEAGDFSLIYSLDVPNSASYGIPSYSVQNLTSSGAFSRIGYYLELKQRNTPLQFVWVSMDAFTTNLAQIGVPTLGSGAFFQQPITNMSVSSSVEGIVNGTGLTGGNMEFWPHNYVQTNAGNVSNASDAIYDWGDRPAPPTSYGSMQLHNSAGGQVLFAFNHWSGSGGLVDIGIGNNRGNINPDWTFMNNPLWWSIKRLQVLAMPLDTTNPPVLMTVSLLPPDWTNLVLVFNKPLHEDAANISHYSLSGGMSVIAATLDPLTKTKVTLVTTPLQAGTDYTLTLSTVQDRTSSHNVMPVTTVEVITTRNQWAGTDGNWSDASKWVGNLMPAENQDVHFGGLSGLSVNGDLSRQYASLYFDAGADPFVIAAGGGTVGLQGGIFDRSSIPQTISCPLQFVSMGAPAVSHTIIVSDKAGLLTINGVISQNVSSNGVKKTGPGTLFLANGFNSYGGVTAIDAGVLSVTTLAPGGNTSSLGTGATVLIGNTNPSVAAVLRYLGPATTIFNRNIILNTGGGTIEQSGTGNLFVGGVISGTGGGPLIKAGSEPLVLSRNNSYDGITYVNNGQLQIRNLTALGNPTAKTIVALGGELATGGALVGTINERIELNGYGVAGSAGALQALDNSTVTFAGLITLASSSSIGGTRDFVVAGQVDGPGGLTKLGSNTITLAGINSYIGPTIISNGTLVLSNASSLTATSTIDVRPGTILDVTPRSDGTLLLASGQTLQGSGTIRGKLTVNGTIAPGPEIEALTNIGAVTLSGGGLYQWQFSDWSGAARADVMQITGSLTINSSPANRFTVELTSAPPLPADFALDGSTAYNWTLFKTTGGIKKFDPDRFSLNTTALSDAPGSFSLALTNNDQDLILRFAPGNTATPLVSQTQCLGNTALFSTAAFGPGPFTYAWQKDAMLLPAETNSSVTVNSVTASDAGTYCVKVTGAFNSVTNCAVLTVTVPATAVGPAPSTNCIGSSATFSTVASGTAPHSFHWTKNGLSIPNATNSTLTLGLVALDDAGTYCVTVTGSCNNVTNCAFLAIQEHTMAVGPTDSTACSGTNVSLCTVASGTGPFTYQWCKGEIPLADETNNCLTLANISTSDADTYSVKVRGACNSITNRATLTVVTNLVAVGPVDEQVCTNSTITLCTLVSTTDPVEYTWAKGDIVIPTATNSCLSISNVSVSDAGSYCVRIVQGCRATTNCATVTVLANIGATALTHVTNACPGTRVTFRTIISGPEFTCQWRKNGTNITAATNSTLTISAVTIADAGDYCVIVADKCNAVTNCASLTVIEEPTATGPADLMAFAGTNVTLCTEVSGHGVFSFQWLKNDIALAGATNHCLTLTNLSETDGATYHVRIASACASITNSAMLMIWTNLTAAGPYDLFKCSQGTATFCTVASGTGPFTYQWCRGTNTLLSETNSCLILTNISQLDADTYCVKVTGANNSVTNCAMLTLATNIVVSGPTNHTACPGQTIHLCTFASEGGPFEYAWLRNGIVLPGATNDYLVLTNITSDQSGLYCAKITAACYSVTNCATLTVIEPPAITEARLVSNGDFELTLNGFAGQAYSLLASEQVTVPLSQWLVLTNSSFTAGPVTFIYPAATNQVIRFFRVASPCEPGNP
jgi:autotransporter-associated beta strand protein